MRGKRSCDLNCVHGFVFVVYCCSGASNAGSANGSSGPLSSPPPPPAGGPPVASAPPPPGGLPPAAAVSAPPPLLNGAPPAGAGSSWSAPSSTPQPGPDASFAESLGAQLRSMNLGGKNPTNENWKVSQKKVSNRDCGICVFSICLFWVPTVICAEMITAILCTYDGSPVFCVCVRVFFFPRRSHVGAMQNWYTWVRR